MTVCHKYRLLIQVQEISTNTKITKRNYDGTEMQYKLIHRNKEHINTI